MSKPRFILHSVLLLWMNFLVNTGVFAQETSLDNYDIIWESPSRNSGESMPCGGGDIGMNVWVENGDVLIYVARSGQFDEHNGLMKSGRIRIRLSPNPFDGGTFKQQLHLLEGYVSIYGKKDGVEAELKLYSEIFSPVINIDIESSKPVSVVATYESWRYADRVIKARENFGNSYKWAAPKNNIIYGDSIRFQQDGVRFYHHNKAETIFDVTVKQQGLDSVKNRLYNPLKQLVFGGHFGGKDFIAGAITNGLYADSDFRGWELKSVKPQKKHALTMALYSVQTPDITQWQQSVDSAWQLVQTQQKQALNATKNWWKQFWQRSYIIIDSSKTSADKTAWEVGRNYNLFRYMLACNAYGEWPTKFNGGLLTVDPSFTDSAMKLTPDYRNWGGGLHTMQNQRLLYFPMIRSGDFDMMQNQLDFYLRLQATAELRSKMYWGHNGACFTEQMENFGLPNYAEYGTKRPEYFDKGVEFNAWLEYQWDTVFEFCLMMLEEHAYTGKNIDGRIPFIMSCLSFFDEHYQYLARQRGSKALDSDGKLVLYPGSGAETYKMATNSTATIIALYEISKKVFYYYDERLRNHHNSMQTPDTTMQILSRQAAWVISFMQRIPNPEFTQFNGRTTIAPAKSWERVQNTESPQLYPVFPWGIYGIGRPGLDTALNTWHYDTLVQKFRSHIGWKQDNIWAARLGLTDEAWKYTSLKLQNSGRRFPAFWGPGFDWVPDHNWGGSGMIGLQEMLLQTHDDEIRILPAWPKDKDVSFRLHAPKQTIVEVRYIKGSLQMLKVIPESRKKDVILPEWLVK